MTLDAQTLAVHVFTNGNILHLWCDDASLGAGYLGDRLTSFFTIINPLLTHGGQPLLQVNFVIGVGIRTAGVVDVNGLVRLHVWYAMLVACNGRSKVYFYHTYSHIRI